MPSLNLRRTHCIIFFPPWHLLERGVRQLAFLQTKILGNVLGKYAPNGGGGGTPTRNIRPGVLVVVEWQGQLMSCIAHDLCDMGEIKLGQTAAS